MGAKASQSRSFPLPQSHLTALTIPPSWDCASVDTSLPEGPRARFL